MSRKKKLLLTRVSGKRYDHPTHANQCKVCGGFLARNRKGRSKKGICKRCTFNAPDKWRCNAICVGYKQKGKRCKMIKEEGTSYCCRHKKLG
mgnify:FL=1